MADPRIPSSSAPRTPSSVLLQAPGSCPAAPVHSTTGPCASPTTWRAHSPGLVSERAWELGHGPGIRKGFLFSGSPSSTSGPLHPSHSNLLNLQPLPSFLGLHPVLSTSVPRLFSILCAPSSPPTPFYLMRLMGERALQEKGTRLQGSKGDLVGETGFVWGNRRRGVPICQVPTLCRALGWVLYMGSHLIFRSLL